MDQSLPRPRALAVIAEDEPILRLDAFDFVTDEGFTVVDTGNAAQARQEIERLDGVDLLFTDICMLRPRDGVDLAVEVARRWPATRISSRASSRTQVYPDEAARRDGFGVSYGFQSAFRGARCRGSRSK